jgi:hypothetical protein
MDIASVMTPISLGHSSPWGRLHWRPSLLSGTFLPRLAVRSVAPEISDRALASLFPTNPAEVGPMIVMCANAGFHANQAGRHVGKARFDLAA